MKRNLKCWKRSVENDTKEQNILRIAGEAYTLQDATEEEAGLGALCLDQWYVERKYKTQVAGLGQVYYDMRSEMQELCFEELIFSGGECIGVYHDALIFLFDEVKTHYQQKYLGEIPISYDQGIAFYDYYYLHSK